jgi:hypothetical protein
MLRKNYFPLVALLLMLLMSLAQMLTDNLRHMASIDLSRSTFVAIQEEEKDQEEEH